jgi:DNA topoisomerase IA
LLFLVQATEADLDSDSWRLYDYIARHFIGSVSPDCRFTKTRAAFSLGGERFHCSGRATVAPGFTAIMPWLAVSDEGLPTFVVAENCQVVGVELHQGRTSPPDYLTESELIGLMEKHGIGTDASIPVHINNICERNYAQVNGRLVSVSFEREARNLGLDKQAWVPHSSINRSRFCSNALAIWTRFQVSLDNDLTRLRF